MKAKLMTACLVAGALAGSTAIASAQGGSTDRNGNAMGSQHVGNGARMTTRTMRNKEHATTGMSTHARRNSPNGSPNAAPTAKQGPQGDPSRDADAPK